MPYKLIGTFTALFFYGCILFPTLFLSPAPADAQLSELTEIQNGIFYLSHKNMGITSETFKTDKYIDLEQAEYLSEISRPKINTPADDNYPFSLVDSYLLDSDLVISYHYDKVLCSANVYPKTAYLSRNDISIADFTDQKSPPSVFFTVVKGKEPFHQDNVKAVTLQFKNFELSKDEMLQKSAYTIENYPAGKEKPDCYSGYAINTTVRINSGIIAVWVGETYAPKFVSQEKPCLDCLPKSACPKPETTIVKWIPDFTNCVPHIPRPKSDCVVYPKTIQTEPPSTNSKCTTCQ